MSNLSHLVVIVLLPNNVGADVAMGGDFARFCEAPPKIDVVLDGDAVLPPKPPNAVVPKSPLFA